MLQKEGSNGCCGRTIATMGEYYTQKNPLGLLVG